MSRHLLILLLIAACAGRVSPKPPAFPPSPQSDALAAERLRARHPVGVAAREVEDTARGRRLATTLWYPAAQGAEEDTIHWDGIFPGHGAWNAPLRTSPRRLPLLLLSHGSGGDGSQLAWMAEAFATRGWLVAAVDHPGDRFGDQSNEGRFAVWRRSRDLSTVLSVLLADPEIGPRINRRWIAAAGHSSGGFTVLALAGARFNPGAMLAYCRGSGAGPECAFIDGIDPATMPDWREAGRSYRDQRIGAVVAMAPAMGPGLTTASLRQIAIPAEVLAGRDDELVPFARNAARVARQMPRGRLITIPHVGHFVFMPVCNEPGRLIAAQVCVDRVPEVDRAAVHAVIVEHATLFLERSLGIPSRPPPRPHRPRRPARL